MLRPTSVTADRTQRTLIINWEDGRVVSYPFQFLADNCRCASCNAERNELTEQGKPFVAKSSELLTIEAVGSYAVSILWKDGCRFGIYTWDYLSSLRPDA